LESQLKGTQILSWSDLLGNAAPAKGRSRIAFGVQGRQYQPIASTPDGVSRMSLTCTWELQADLYRVNKPVNHDEAMDFTFTIESDILYGFQPYAEFSPLLPVRGGNVRFDGKEGRFYYSSEFQSIVVLPKEQLTAIAEVQEPEIVSVSLWNNWAIDGTQDTIWEKID
jgi:hypothetical protein